MDSWTCPSFWLFDIMYNKIFKENKINMLEKSKHVTFLSKIFLLLFCSQNNPTLLTVPYNIWLRFIVPILSLFPSSPSRYIFAIFFS